MPHIHMGELFQLLAIINTMSEYLIFTETHFCEAWNFYGDHSNIQYVKSATPALNKTQVSVKLKPEHIH